MAAIELRDRERIAALCRREPGIHAYELGDLDDFFWPYTSWLGWDADGEVTQVVLVYAEHDLPVLIALPGGERREMAMLLEDVVADLPTRVYAHTGADMLGVLGARYGLGVVEPHLKMALAAPERLGPAADDVVALAIGDRVELDVFYATAYPGTWFVPRMLETGRYVGLRDQRGLACVAGVHVWSPRWRVAALGNVATRPDVRGRGLAQRACTALCRRLLDDGIDTIALNVHADNAPAIRAYERLGFAVAAEYVEVFLQDADGVNKPVDLPDQHG